MAAAGTGRAEIVQLLLGYGAKVNQGKSDDDVTAIFIAAQSGHLDCVVALADAGADLDAPASDDGSTPTYAACWNGHTEVVKFFASRGADIHKAKKCGRAPIYTAAFYGHLHVVQLLLELGAQLVRSVCADGQPNGPAKQLPSCSAVTVASLSTMQCNATIVILKASTARTCFFFFSFSPFLLFLDVNHVHNL